MPTISGNLNLVTDRPVDSISEVWVRARETRGQGDRLTVGVNDRVAVTDGAIEFTALPGAAVLVLVQNGMPIETHPMLVTDEAQQSLRAVVQAVQIADSAERRELEQLAVEVLNNVARAAQYRTEAASSASKARQSQSAAESAAGAAASGAVTQVRSELEGVLSGAKSARDAAKGHADRAASSASSAAAATADALREEMKPTVRAGAAYMAQSLAASHMATDAANAAKASLARLDNIRAWFRGAGAPPASISGARVGDWWLDTSSLTLHEITRVEPSITSVVIGKLNGS